MAKKDETMPETKNTAPVNKAPVTLDNIDADGSFVEEQVGYYPYWNPRVYCTECAPVEPGAPGRQLADREFSCKVHPNSTPKGTRFLGVLLARDETPTDKPDKPFIRYTFQATDVAIPCQQGPSAEAEDTIVGPGEFFTISHYDAMNVEKFYGHEILVTTISKRAIKDGHTLWRFSVKVRPGTKQILDSQRKNLAAAAKARFELLEKQRQEAKLLAGRSTSAREHVAEVATEEATA